MNAVVDVVQSKIFQVFQDLVNPESELLSNYEGFEIWGYEIIHVPGGEQHMLGPLASHFDPSVCQMTVLRQGLLEGFHQLSALLPQVLRF